jgi:hypothetical protein
MYIYIENKIKDDYIKKNFTKKDFIASFTEEEYSKNVASKIYDIMKRLEKEETELNGEYEFHKEYYIDFVKYYKDLKDFNEKNNFNFESMEEVLTQYWSFEKVGKNGFIIQNYE